MGATHSSEPTVIRRDLPAIPFEQWRSCAERGLNAPLVQQRVTRIFYETVAWLVRFVVPGGWPLSALSRAPAAPASESSPIGFWCFAAARSRIKRTAINNAAHNEYRRCGQPITTNGATPTRRLPSE